MYMIFKSARFVRNDNDLVEQECNNPKRLLTLHINSFTSWNVERNIKLFALNYLAHEILVISKWKGKDLLTELIHSIQNWFQGAYNLSIFE